jgi:O-acetyl-ADP-ribose deacetylase (regulator of RNase III)
VIEYVIGDATRPPEGAGAKIIAHVCNDAGGWGHGFVVAVSRRWAQPERAYRRWYKLKTDPDYETTGKFGLGESQLVSVQGSMTIRGVETSGSIHVLNMVAQEGFGPSKEPRIRYPALALCLRHLDRFAKDLGATVHAPRIGCGLGGGDWPRVAGLVSRLVEAPVFIYDLPSQ